MTSRISETRSDDSLAEVLDRFREELAVIRQVLHEITIGLQWANRNREPCEDSGGNYRHITNMPLDPTAPDWSERLNQFSAAELPSADVPPTPNQLGCLF